MNNRFIAGIRQRRDKSLDAVRTAVIAGYLFGSFMILGLREMNGEDVRMTASLVYTSYAVLFFAFLKARPGSAFELTVKSFTSILALAVVLVIAFPVRVVLYGLAGYKKYVACEAKRVIKMEVSRWKERQ